MFSVLIFPFQLIQYIRLSYPHRKYTAPHPKLQKLDNQYFTTALLLGLWASILYIRYYQRQLPPVVPYFFAYKTPTAAGEITAPAGVFAALHYRDAYFVAPLANALIA